MAYSVELAFGEDTAGSLNRADDRMGAIWQLAITSRQVSLPLACGSNAKTCRLIQDNGDLS